MSRSLCRLARTVARSAVIRPTVASAARSAALPASFRSISTTLPRFESTPLSAKLQEELKFEEENEDQGGEPQFLTDFKSDGVWTVVNEPGADEVILTRSYGNESIRLIFSISDLDAVPEADEYDPEAAPTAVEEDGEHGPTEESFPVETAITITKPGVDGALTIDAVAQDGLFTIQNISFYQDAGLALGQSGEDDWKRQGLYMGPAFDNLDEGVQAEFEAFLDERGINSSLALFIPDLAEYKEQKEYVSWLKSVNGFIEA
ncbi:mitochondrial glyco protein [Leucosporidium creatinivorum]|uniref:Mitochondrial glyco protein n=1 Tax=Leucosporidium creatinivorum TaxID=106004 RepID=A0A1Y2G3J8_9BASI|nr:mitochondrial glyco protein [Leucosporidium creatinivorum]